MWNFIRAHINFYSYFFIFDLYSEAGKFSFSFKKQKTKNPIPFPYLVFQFPRSVKICFFFTSHITTVKHFYKTESCELLNCIYPTNNSSKKKKKSQRKLCHYAVTDQPGRRKSKYCNRKHFAINPQQKLLGANPLNSEFLNFQTRNSMDSITNAVFDLLFLNTIGEYVLQKNI